MLLQKIKTCKIYRKLVNINTAIDWAFWGMVIFFILWLYFMRGSYDTTF